ncbi:hypothetical protein HN954_01270 [bacterium]|nr:hypothetical protein [bacterium]MBT6832289.1 hypothetical protein [bacterium]MBT6996042.1 hypothetical protein [bacterium]MBT7772305.1 hypothetical protein [bacterium]
MNKKIIGFGIGICAVSVVAGAFHFFLKDDKTSSQHFSSEKFLREMTKEPDLMGEFQRIEGDFLVLKPLDRMASPFKGHSRKEIREKMHTFSEEERNARREEMRKFIEESEEISIPLSAGVKVLKQDRSVQILEILEKTPIGLWKNEEGFVEKILLLERKNRDLNVPK